MPLITTKDLEAFKSRAGKATRAPQIAKCPLCEGDNIFRHAEEGEGPGDYCIDCGHSFPHKPGTITAQQHARRQAGKPDIFKEVGQRWGQILQDRVAQSRAAKAL